MVLKFNERGARLPTLMFVPCLRRLLLRIMMIVRTMMNMMQKIIDYGGKDDSGNGTCSPLDNAYVPKLRDQ